jgi:Ca-activated chloride channel family protein
VSATREDLTASFATALLLVGLVALPFALFGWLGEVRFDAPWGFALGVLVLPLLILFMLKSRRPRRPVGSLMFWQAISVDQQAASPFKRLRRNLALILLLIGLAAMTFGRAEPVVQADVRQGRALVVVLDTSASMEAQDQDQEGTRFAAARVKARELFAGLGRGDRAALIAVDRSARLVVALTDDEEALAAGLSEVRTRHVGTNLAEGLLLAAQLVKGAGQDPEVVLLSDGGGPPPPPVDLGGPLRYVRFGTRSPNVGIVARDLRPAASGEEGAWQVFVSVRSTAASAREALVSLVREGRTLAARRLKLPPQGEQAVSFEERLGPGPLEVRLLPPKQGQPLDPFPLDDVAYLVVPSALHPRVALVGKGPSPAWERALLAASARIEPLPAGGDDPGLRLVIYDGEVPAHLPPRDAILVGPRTKIGPLEPGPLVKAPLLTAWNRTDPALRFLDLADLRHAIAEARPFTLGPGARVLIQGQHPQTKAPLVLAATWKDGRARRVALAFDPHHSSWPLKASFPIFVQGCLDLAAERGSLPPQGVSAGAGVSVPVALATSEVELSGPMGEPRTLRARDGHVQVDGLLRVGHYRLRAGTRFVDLGVNLADPAEGRIESAPRLETDAPQVEGVPERKRPLEVGRWFALLALIVLTLEAWAYHRRW